MSESPEISVIVTTYNKERELSLVLEAYRHQSFKDFELIVADDGSGPATREVIERARERSDFPIIHSWQEDEGFRAARSRNLAINKARGRLVALTDGDCIPLPDYLTSQRAAFRESSYLAGERYLTSEEEGAAIDLPGVESGRCFENLPEDQVKRLKVLEVKNWFYRKLRLKERPHVMSCNLALSRADLERINGFDERYVGWGHEDTDLGRRLRRAGIGPTRSLAPGKMIHLWHKAEASFNRRVRDCPNVRYFHRGFFLSACRKGLRERAYEDLKIRVRSTDPELEPRARDQLSGAAVNGEAEIELLLWAGGSADFSPRVEAPILVLDGRSEPPRGLLHQAGMVIAPPGLLSDDSEDRERHARAVSFDKAGLEDLRAFLDQTL